MVNMSGYPVAGFDIGNVILRNDTDNPASAALSMAEQPQKYIDGAVETIGKVVDWVSSDNAFMISKCGIRMQQHTREFFEKTDFYNRTGFDPDNVLFCRRRREKAPIAAELGLTHFVDDRLGILDMMETVGTKILFQRPDKPPMAADMLEGHDQSIRIASGWPDVWQAIVETAHQ